jgi:tubulin-specific chaperone A
LFFASPDDRACSDAVAQQKAAEETRGIFGPLRQRIEEAVGKLEEQIAIAEGANGSADELEKAKEMLKKVKGASDGEL